MERYGTTVADLTHVDPVQAEAAVNVDEHMDDVLPEPHIGEPVRALGSLGTAAVAAVLAMEGVPWWGLALIALFLIGLDEWKRSLVSPAR